MKGFMRLLASDLRFGTRSIAWRLFLVAAVILAVGFVSMSTVGMFAPELKGQMNLGECIFALFAGMEKFIPETGHEFKFPISWLVLFIVTAYVVFDYPVRDLSRMGARIIAVTGNRWQWWLAKCAWVLILTLAIWMLMALVCVIGAALQGGFNPVPVPEIAKYSGIMTQAPVEGSMLPFLLAMPFVLCAIMMIQLLVSVAAGPVVGLVVTTAMLLASAFYVTPALLGNSLMAAMPMSPCTEVWIRFRVC